MFKMKHSRKIPLQEFAMREFCVCLALECLVTSSKQASKQTNKQKVIDNNNKNNVLSANKNKKLTSEREPIPIV